MFDLIRAGNPVPLSKCDEEQSRSEAGRGVAECGHFINRSFCFPLSLSIGETNIEKKIKKKKR
jgi:hypothetical protein